MTKQLFVALACSKIWKVIEKSPTLVSLERNVTKLWAKSHLLIHPYIPLDRGFIYIHVPKVAGTSISEALGLKVTPTTLIHSTVREVVPFMKIVTPELVVITFVRNPYSRFVSLYNFARMDESQYHSVKNPERAPYGKHPDYDLLSDKNLEQCAELLVAGKVGDPRGVMNNWRPQVEWLIDMKGKLAVDFIGRLESLESDLRELKTRFGIESKPIPWLNKSVSREEKTPQFTERTLDLVRLYYKRDFEMLGYDEACVPE